jgi:hypothetical protein
MPYAFPTDLASEVIARWETLSAHQHGPAPVLPEAPQLRHILETAFFASLEREEGRSLRFVLCCTPDLTVLRDGLGDEVPFVALQAPRPVTVESIRALAPAISPNNAAMLVRCPRDVRAADACTIAGVLHVGAQLARARSGRSFYHRPAPRAFMVDAREPGELHLYQGGFKLAGMRGGRLHDQIAFSALEFLPIAKILGKGERALRPAVTVPENEPTREWSDFQWTALLNTVLCTVNGVKAHGHGGTILLVAPGSESTLPVRIKYELGASVEVLANRFVHFLNARHELAGVKRRGRGAVAADAAPATMLPQLESATDAAEVELADAADLVAQLSAVDGAVVLSSDLRVLGFGAEIVLDAAAPVSAYEVAEGVHLASAADQRPVVDSESFGMRHRSALRCISVAQEAAAFVVSQDGTVSLFWKQGRDVLLKRNVNTANPNLVGGA